MPAQTREEMLEAYLNKGFKYLKLPLTAKVEHDDDIDPPGPVVKVAEMGIWLIKSETDWEMTQEIYIPGSYWVPPDCDIVERGTFMGRYSILAKIVELYMHDELKNFSMDCMAEEMEEHGTD